MANPASIDDKPAVLDTDVTERSVTLNPARVYRLRHDVENNAGATDTNPIYLAFDASVAADATEGADKFKLPAGEKETIGPGIKLLKFATAAGGPTMSVMPGTPASGHVAV